MSIHWLFVFLLLILAADIYLVHQVEQNRPDVAEKNHRIDPKLLVLVIAGGGGKHYDFYRHFWKRIAEKMQPEGVHIYLLSYNDQLARIRYLPHDFFLQFPGKNSLIPGCLESTIRGMEYITREKLPGYSAPKILRTNLSTFWNFWMVFRYLARPEMQKHDLYAGIQYILNKDDVFVPGGYLFLSQRTMRMLIRKESELDKTIIDDISIGRFMKKQNVRITYNLEACIIEDEASVDNVLHKRQCQEQFIYRIKTINQIDDAHLWLRLYTEYYDRPQVSLV